MEHGGLAGPGIALDTHYAVPCRQDQLHRIVLVGCQRPPVEMPLHRPGPHRGIPADLARAHQRDGRAFLACRAVGRERVVRSRKVHGMQRTGLLERRHLPFDRPDGKRAQRAGERGGEKIGPREHGFALREVLHRPGHGLGGRTPIGWRLPDFHCRGLPVRRGGSLPDVPNALVAKRRGPRIRARCRRPVRWPGPR